MQRLSLTCGDLRKLSAKPAHDLTAMPKVMGIRFPGLKLICATLLIFAVKMTQIQKHEEFFGFFL